jgi:hypothetical protein
MAADVARDLIEESMGRLEGRDRLLESYRRRRTK